MQQSLTVQKLMKMFVLLRAMLSGVSVEMIMVNQEHQRRVVVTATVHVGRRGRLLLGTLPRQETAKLLS